jgi:hypothetical protein
MAQQNEILRQLV